MEENTSMFNNKIVGVLVAVIVLATVLVPICNAFSNGNGGGNGSDDTDSLVFNSDGIRATLIDLNDHSKRYTATTLVIDGSLVGIGIGEYVDGEDIYMDIKTVTTSENNVDIFYNEELNRWVTSADISGDLVLPIPDIDGARFWMFDTNGEYIVHMDDLVIPVQKINTNSYIAGSIWLVYSEYDGPSIEILWGVFNESVSTNIYTEGYGEFTSVPTVSVNNGIVTIDGNFVDNYLDDDNVEQTDILKQEDGYASSIIISSINSEESNPGNSDNSNGGISSTLIGIIPVFVAVALLGAIVTLFIRKDSLTE